MPTQPVSPSFTDREDFDNACRGFIGALDPCIVKGPNGNVVWNNDEYSFLEADCAETANPKLWRQGQLNYKQGLFQITHGVYQVRGFDLANMTIVEGQHGVIVVDPLTSHECAAAALALYRRFRGDRKVTGVILSHPHIDHFGGARAILPEASVPIIGPDGFMEEALSENILAGESMQRRAASMYGTRIPKGPKGQIGCGLGMAVSRGTSSVTSPNMHIKETGEVRVVDGIELVFQVVPDTEAPAEINFYLPSRQALYIAECATHCLHNIITLRGALVRDAKKWSRYLNETLELFGQAESLCAGHGWPTWGRQGIARLVSEQRDLYAYLHDQTLRKINQGMTGIEIAEAMVLPPALERAWHAQGYYGSVSHNVKGIYQRYMGWFDGNPVNLWKHPPREEGERYVACLGGIDEVVRKAADFEQSGDLRFAATLLGHAVAIGGPCSEKAREHLAAVFEKLAYGAENGTWRNFYLTGALDLKTRGPKAPAANGSAGLTQGLSVEQLFDWLAIRLDGERGAMDRLAVAVDVGGQSYRLNLSNGALTFRSGGRDKADARIVMEDKTELVKVLQGAAADVKDGDGRAWQRLMSLVGVGGHD